MKKAALSRVNDSAFFTTKNTELTTTGEKSQRLKRARGKFQEGIVGGERVLIATPPAKELEKGIEIRVRVALASAGVLVWKHVVEPCYECGSRPPSRVGLGVGVSDLICVVPPYGRFLGIEMKQPGKKPSEEQRRWLEVVRRFGGVTGVATSVEEAMALVREARELPRV